MKSQAITHPLSLRRRLVVSGDGRAVVETIALCPHRGEAGLAECMACEHFGGVQELETSEGERRRAILCRVAPPAEPAAGPPSAADRTPISAAMSPDVLCVREDVSVDELGSLFLEHHISGAPVVDAEGFPIGVVTKTDLVRTCRSPGPAARAAGDIMMPLAFTLCESAPISQAAALMAFEEVHRIPVVSDAGKVVGILSSLDVMRWLAGHDGYLVREPQAPPLA